MKTLDDAIPQFISELDQMLYHAGFEWGEQWDGVKPSANREIETQDSVF